MSRQFLINWKATKDAKKKITDGRTMTGQTMYPFSGTYIRFWSHNLVFWFRNYKINFLTSECSHPVAATIYLITVFKIWKYFWGELCAFCSQTFF